MSVHCAGVEGAVSLLQAAGLAGVGLEQSPPVVNGIGCSRAMADLL